MYIKNFLFYSKFTSCWARLALVAACPFGLTSACGGTPPPPNKQLGQPEETKETKKTPKRQLESCKNERSQTEQLVADQTKSLLQLCGFWELAPEKDVTGQIKTLSLYDRSSDRNLLEENVLGVENGLDKAFELLDNLEQSICIWKKHDATCKEMSQTMDEKEESLGLAAYINKLKYFRKVLQEEAAEFEKEQKKEQLESYQEQRSNAAQLVEKEARYLDLCLRGQFDDDLDANATLKRAVRRLYEGTTPISSKNIDGMVTSFNNLQQSMSDWQVCNTKCQEICAALDEKEEVSGIRFKPDTKDVWEEACIELYKAAKQQGATVPLQGTLVEEGDTYEKLSPVKKMNLFLSREHQAHKKESFKEQYKRVTKGQLWEATDLSYMVGLVTTGGYGIKRGLDSYDFIWLASPTNSTKGEIYLPRDTIPKVANLFLEQYRKPDGAMHIENFNEFLEEKTANEKPLGAKQAEKAFAKTLFPVVFAEETDVTGYFTNFKDYRSQSAPKPCASWEQYAALGRECNNALDGLVAMLGPATIDSEWKQLYCHRFGVATDYTEGSISFAQCPVRPKHFVGIARDAETEEGKVLQKRYQQILELTSRELENDDQDNIITKAQKYIRTNKVSGGHMISYSIPDPESNKELGAFIGMPFTNSQHVYSYMGFQHNDAPADIRILHILSEGDPEKLRNNKIDAIIKEFTTNMGVMSYLLGCAGRNYVYLVPTLNRLKKLMNTAQSCRVHDKFDMVCWYAHGAKDGRSFALTIGEETVDTEYIKSNKRLFSSLTKPNGMHIFQTCCAAKNGAGSIAQTLSSCTGTAVAGPSCTSFQIWFDSYDCIHDYKSGKLPAVNYGSDKIITSVPMTWFVRGKQMYAGDLYREPAGKKQQGSDSLFHEVFLAQ